MWTESWSLLTVCAMLSNLSKFEILGVCVTFLGGGGVGRFWYETSLKYLIPLKQWSYFHTPPKWTPKFLVHPPSQLLSPAPITSSVIVCRFLYYGLYTFSMCKCLKRLQENSDTKVWKTGNNSSLKLTNKIQNSYLAKCVMLKWTKTVFCTIFEPDFTVLE